MLAARSGKASTFICKNTLRDCTSPFTPNTPLPDDAGEADVTGLPTKMESGIRPWQGPMLLLAKRSRPLQA